MCLWSITTIPTAARASVERWAEKGQPHKRRGSGWRDVGRGVGRGVDWGEGGEGAVFRRAQAKRSTHYYAHLRWTWPEPMVWKWDANLVNPGLPPPHRSGVLTGNVWFAWRAAAVHQSRHPPPPPAPPPPPVSPDPPGWICTAARTLYSRHANRLIRTKADLHINVQL